MRRYRVPELVAGFLLGFAILLIIFLSSSDIAAHYEVCEATKEGAKECATYNVLSYALHKVGAALNDYNGAITAIATAFIAWFTLSLRQSTDKLWDAGKDALETTERAFVFIDGFNIELTTSADDNRPDAIEHLPQTYRNDPGLFITRFAAQPR
jgi:hypothetical protein